MEKDSALYQLMDTRMHSVMNGIVSSDGEYQAILRKSDIYSGELDRMDLSKEIRLLIDRYVSEQNALGSRFGMRFCACHIVYLFCKILSYSILLCFSCSLPCRISCCSYSIYAHFSNPPLSSIILTAAPQSFRAASAPS